MIAGLWKAWGSLVSFHLDSWEETNSPNVCANLPLWDVVDHLLCLLRCCSMSNSHSMWSWKWWQAACGLRGCSAWRDTGQLLPPGRTLSTSWSPARCPASCDWTKARSCRPSPAPPLDSTPWGILQPRLTSSASLKSTEAWNLFLTREQRHTHKKKREIHLFLYGWDSFVVFFPPPG